MSTLDSRDVADCPDCLGTGKRPAPFRVDLGGLGSYTPSLPCRCQNPAPVSPVTNQPKEGV